MDRRKALRNLTGLAALAFLPKQHLFALQQKKAVHFLGIGSAGTKVLHLFQKREMGDHFTSINDGRSAMADTHFIQYSHPMTERDRVIQEYYHPDTIAPFVYPEEVKDIFQKDQSYVLLAGLGGYTATHMSKAIIPQLLERNIDFKAVFSLPFAFEGKKKLDLAKEIVEMSLGLPQIRFVDNEAMRKNMGNLSIREAFRKIDEKMVEEYANQEPSI